MKKKTKEFQNDRKEELDAVRKIIQERNVVDESIDKLYIFYTIDKNDNYPMPLLDLKDSKKSSLEYELLFNKDIICYQFFQSDRERTYLSRFYKCFHELIDEKSYLNGQIPEIPFEFIVLRQKRYKEINDLIKKSKLSPLKDYILLLIAIAQKEFTEKRHIYSKNSKGTSDKNRKSKKSTPEENVKNLSDLRKYFQPNSSEDQNKQAILKKIDFIFSTHGRITLDYKPLLDDTKQAINGYFNEKEIIDLSKELLYDSHYKQPPQIKFLEEFVVRLYYFIVDFSQEIKDEKFSERKYCRIIYRFLMYSLYPGLDSENIDYENFVKSIIKRNELDVYFHDNQYKDDLSIEKNYFDDSLHNYMKQPILLTNWKIADEICEIFHINNLRSEIAILIQSIKLFSRIHDLQTSPLNFFYDNPPNYQCDNKPASEINRYRHNIEISIDGKKIPIDDKILSDMLQEFISEVSIHFPYLDQEKINVGKESENKIEPKEFFKSLENENAGYHKNPFEEDVIDQSELQNQTTQGLYSQIEISRLINPILIRLARSCIDYISTLLKDKYNKNQIEEIAPLITAMVFKKAIVQLTVDESLSVKRLSQIIKNSL